MKYLLNQITKIDNLQTIKLFNLKLNTYEKNE